MAKLALQDCNETLFFRAVVQKIQKDPTLARVVKTWVVYDGDTSDLSPPADVKLPYVSLSIGADSGSIETEQHSYSPLRVVIRQVTDTTNLDDAMNLWSAMRNAIFPGDGSMSKIVQQYNATQLTLVKPSYEPKNMPDGTRMIEAIGAVRAMMWAKSAL